LILCAPHNVYRNLNLDHEVIVDIWNFWGMGNLSEQTHSSVGSV